MTERAGDQIFSSPPKREHVAAATPDAPRTRSAVRTFISEEF